MNGATKGQIPSHFIVFDPGYMGSQLHDGETGEMVDGEADWRRLSQALAAVFS